MPLVFRHEFFKFFRPEVGLTQVGQFVHRVEDIVESAQFLRVIDTQEKDLIFESVEDFFHQKGVSFRICFASL